MAGLPHMTLMRAAAEAKKRRNPLDYVTGVALGKHLRSNPGDRNYGRVVQPPSAPPIVIPGGSPKPRKRRGPLAY